MEIDTHLDILYSFDGNLLDAKKNYIVAFSACIYESLTDGSIKY